MNTSPIFGVVILISQIRHTNSMGSNLSPYTTSKIVRKGMCRSCYASGVAVSLNEETGMTCCDKCMNKKS